MKKSGMNLIGFYASRNLRKKTFRLSLLTALVIAFSGIALADGGKVTGNVYDAETGEPIIGASVYLQGTKTGEATDLDGHFLIRHTENGLFIMTVSSIGYQSVNIENIKLANMETVNLDISLERKNISTKKIVVTATALQNNEAGLLRNRQKSITISDAISSETMSKSGSSDAAEAMNQVTGASVVDGKYVFVRGLGGRYSNATLNGASIPNADPDNQSVQMNLFSTNLLDNVTIEKTYTPDKPGDFSGGSINLNTKDMPDKRTITFSSSVTHNSNTTGATDFISAPSSDLEWLAFDNNYRRLPNELADPGSSRDITPRTGTLDEGLAVDKIHKAFNSTMQHKIRKVPMNQSYAFSFGDTYLINEHPLGIQTSLSYSNSYSSYDNGTVARYNLTEVNADHLESDYVVPDMKSKAKVQWGGLANVSYSFHNNHKLSVQYIYNREGSQENRYIIGKADGSTTGYFQSRSLLYTEQYVSSFQINGEHAFNKVRVEWKASNSKSKRNEPDARFFTNDWYLKSVIDENTGKTVYDTVYSMVSAGGTYQPTHFFRDIDVTNNQFNLDFSLPIYKAYDRESKFNFGTSYLSKERINRERRFEIRYNAPIYYDGNPDNFVSQDNMGINWDNTILVQTPELDTATSLIVDSIYLDFLDQWFYDTVGVDTLKWDTVSIDTSYRFVYNKWISESAQTYAQNNYTGNLDIFSYYFMWQTPIISKLQFVGGARFEKTNMKILSDAIDSENGSGKIDEGDWLPSISFTYALTNDMNLRLSYGRTLARPTFKEKSKSVHYEFFLGLIENGNPDLKHTKINNYDVRWEWFNGPGRIYAISLYYKDFIHPIERVLWGSNNDITWENVDRAQVYGVEFELRQSMGWITSKLENLKFDANFTLINSQINISDKEMVSRLYFDSSASDTRQLQGQSPYLLNLGLTYANFKGTTVASIQYNVSGKRLSEVGRGGMPDIYEYPFPLINSTLKQNIWHGIALKVTGKNILNSKVSKKIEYKGDEYIFRKYSTGRSISVGLSYQF